MGLQMFQENKASFKPISEIKHVVAIAAGKGGVGKSTVAVNLGLVLKDKGYKVGILDADIYGPSIPLMLKEDYMPSQNGDLILPALCQGIKMLSMAYFKPSHEASVVRGPIANTIIHHFLNNVIWGDLDFLLVDFPPGTGDIQISLSQQANFSSAMIVTTPQEVALLDVRKAIDMFQQMNIPVIGIVENMSYYIYEKTKEIIHLFGKGGGKRLSEEFTLPFLGEIPLDPHVGACGDKGESLFKHETSCAAEAFKQLGPTFLEQVKNLSKSPEKSLLDSSKAHFSGDLEHVSRSERIKN